MSSDQGNADAAFSQLKFGKRTYTLNVFLWCVYVAETLLADSFHLHKNKFPAVEWASFFENTN
jgi:hypothetical protein